MTRWAGWGAGPAGAGSAGGPSRFFLAFALAGTVIVTVVLATQERWPAAAVAGLGAVYFALRLFAGLGRSKE